MYEDVRGKYHVIELLKQLHATIDNCNTCPPVRALVHWPEAYNTLSPPWNGGIFRPRPDIPVDVSPTRGYSFWGPRDTSFQILDMKKFTFL